MSFGAGRYRRAGEIFAAAIDLPAAERACFLDRECGDDSELRSRVDQMLAADELMETGRTTGDGPALRSSLLAWASHPTHIGDYTVLGVIGQGGMGTVYLAEQEKPRRRVAIKMIRGGLLSPQILSRFRHEAEILGQLKHPGIAHIYEAGTHTEGGERRPYFAMEFVEGVSLTRFAREHDLPTARRLELFVRVCDAVQHAHDRGVVHRDLKPDNILVTPAGDPKVLDFGVARATSEGFGGTTVHTGAGQLLGTVAYMSPEQASGSCTEVEARSDVYALGIVLYELLSDRLPYLASRDSIPELLRAIQESDPTPLSMLDSRFRGDISTIVAKATEKDPERRYQSADALGSDIGRFLRDQPIVARRASRMYRLRKFTRRNRGVVAGLAAAMVTLVVGTIASMLLAMHGLEQERLANANAARSEWNSYRLAISSAEMMRARGEDGRARETLRSAPASHRHWEWDFLHWQLARGAPEPSVVRPVTASVAAFAADGRAIAAIALFDHVALFALDSGEVVGRIGEGDAEMRAVIQRRLAAAPLIAMTPDGAVLLTASESGGVILWSTHTAERISTLRERPGNAKAISPDGRTLAWWDRGRAYLIDVDTDSAHGPFPGSAPLARRSSAFACFSPDGRRVAWSTWEAGVHTLFIQDRDSGRVLVERETPSKSHAGMPAWSPGGELVAVRSASRPTRVMWADTLMLQGEFTHGSSAVERCAFLGPSQLIHPEGEGAVSVLDLGQGSRRSLVQMPAGVTCTGVVVSPDGERAILHGKGWARLEDLRTERGSRRLDGHESYVYAHAWSPGGELLATAAWDGRVWLWDGRTGEPLGVLSTLHEGRPDVPKGLCFGEGMRWLEFVGLREGSPRSLVVRRWDLASGEEIVEAAGDHRAYLGRAPAGMRLEAGVMSLISPAPRAGDFNVVSRDGRLLALAEADGVSVVDRATGAKVCRLAGMSPQVVGLSGDGALMVTGDANGVLRLWNVADGSLVATAGTQLGEVFSTVFSPDDKRIVTAGRRGIGVVAVPGLEVLLHLDQHDDYVRSASFSPDGSRIASTSGDFSVRLWDAVPRRQRIAEAARWEERCGRVAARVERLLAEFGDAVAAADRVEATDGLSDEDGRAVMYLLIRRVLERGPFPSGASFPSGESAGPAPGG